MRIRMFNQRTMPRNVFRYLLNATPKAVAIIEGNKDFQNLKGSVKFYETPFGVVVLTEVEGLPITTTNIFAEHIHSGSECVDNFESAEGHYNPQNKPHPEHAGDLPPLFSNEGYALGAVLTTRFTIKEIIGRTVIIHDNRDDFTSQPSGDSGERIACGEIKKFHI